MSQTMWVNMVLAAGLDTKVPTQHVPTHRPIARWMAMARMGRRYLLPRRERETARLSATATSGIQMLPSATGSVELEKPKEPQIPETVAR